MKKAKPMLKPALSLALTESREFCEESFRIKGGHSLNKWRDFVLARAEDLYGELEEDVVDFVRTRTLHDLVGYDLLERGYTREKIAIPVRIQERSSAARRNVEREKTEKQPLERSDIVMPNNKGKPPKAVKEKAVKKEKKTKEARPQKRTGGGYAEARGYLCNLLLKNTKARLSDRELQKMVCDKFPACNTFRNKFAHIQWTRRLLNTGQITGRPKPEPASVRYENKKEAQRYTHAEGGKQPAGAKPSKPAAKAEKPAAKGPSAVQHLARILKENNVKKRCDLGIQREMLKKFPENTTFKTFSAVGRYRNMLNKGLIPNIPKPATPILNFNVQGVVIPEAVGGFTPKPQTKTAGGPPHPSKKLLQDMRGDEDDLPATDD